MSSLSGFQSAMSAQQQSQEAMYDFLRKQGGLQQGLQQMNGVGNPYMQTPEAGRATPGLVPRYVEVEQENQVLLLLDQPE